jgi:hypothetical protein
MNLEKLKVNTKNQVVTSKDIQIFMNVEGGAEVNVGAFTDIEFTVKTIYDDYFPSGQEDPEWIYRRKEITGTLNRGHVSPELIDAFINHLPGSCAVAGRFIINVTLCFPGRGSTTGGSTLYSIRNVRWDDINLAGGENAMYREKLSFTATQIILGGNNFS